MRLHAQKKPLIFLVSCQVEHFQGTVGVHQTPRKPGRYAGHLTLSPGDPIPGSLCCVSARQHSNARLAPYIAALRVCLSDRHARPELGIRIGCDVGPLLPTAGLIQPRIVALVLVRCPFR